MLISDVITYVDSNFHNVVGDGTKIQFINKLEQDLYSDLIEIPVEEKIDLVADQKNYSLPSPYLYSDILTVEVNGETYTRGSVYDNQEKEYYFENGGISIRPIPIQESTDGLVIVFRKKPTVKTKENMDTVEAEILKDFGDQWIDMYFNYIAYRILIDLKEYSEANNFASLYNKEEDDLYTMMVRQNANLVANNKKARW